MHEFDYKQENQVVYQENGVTIRSWPAIHCIDGAVSYTTGLSEFQDELSLRLDKFLRIGLPLKPFLHHSLIIAETDREIDE